MPYRILIILILLALAPLAVNGQNTTSGDTIAVSGVTTEETEEVDGVFAFAGYLGKKLFDEVSDQFGEEEEEPPKEEGVKRVRIKLGPIKIERIEKR